MASRTRSHPWCSPLKARGGIWSCRSVTACLYGLPLGHSCPKVPSSRQALPRTGTRVSRMDAAVDGACHLAKATREVAKSKCRGLVGGCPGGIAKVVLPAFSAGDHGALPLLLVDLVDAGIPGSRLMPRRRCFRLRWSFPTTSRRSPAARPEPLRPRGRCPGVVGTPARHARALRSRPFLHPRRSWSLRAGGADSQAALHRRAGNAGGPPRPTRRGAPHRRGAAAGRLAGKVKPVVFSPPRA